jgi:Zn-dependent peptidase ImmA (M78 family)/DNA-binding XRE family transcriptional regulator
MVFEPGRLRLARELRGVSQAEVAAKLGATPAAISQFESGATRPSADTVKQLAGQLRVPEAFFALPVSDTHEGFFRSLRRTTVSDRRRARAIAHIAHDAAVHPHAAIYFGALKLPTLRVSGLSVQIEEIEEYTEIVRRAWRVPRGPAPNLVELLEEHGIVVIRLPLESADVDAFSLPFADRPVIVLGSDKNDRARSRFDAAHELGHLVIHGDQIWGLPEVEQQAHQFAAAFLLPKEVITRELPTRVDWPTLFSLKKRWQVSLAALLMRARTLGRMSEATYLTAVKAMSAHGWRRVEPVPLGDPECPKGLAGLMVEPTVSALRQTLPADALAAIGESTA